MVNLDTNKNNGRIQTFMATDELTFQDTIIVSEEHPGSDAWSPLQNVNLDRQLVTIQSDMRRSETNLFGFDEEFLKSALKEKKSAMTDDSGNRRSYLELRYAIEMRISDTETRYFSRAYYSKKVGSRMQMHSKVIESVPLDVDAEYETLRGMTETCARSYAWGEDTTLLDPTRDDNVPFSQLEARHLSTARDRREESLAQDFLDTRPLLSEYDQSKSKSTSKTPKAQLMDRVRNLHDASRSRAQSMAAATQNSAGARVSLATHTFKRSHSPDEIELNARPEMGSHISRQSSGQLLTPSVCQYSLFHMPLLTLIKTTHMPLKKPKHGRQSPGTVTVSEAFYTRSC